MHTEHLNAVDTLCFRVLRQLGVHLPQLRYLALVGMSTVIVPSRLFLEQGALLVLQETFLDDIAIEMLSKAVLHQL